MNEKQNYTSIIIPNLSYITPGSIHGNRVCLQENPTRVFVANDTSIIQATPQWNKECDTLTNLLVETITTDLKEEIMNISIHKKKNFLGAIDALGYAQIFSLPTIKTDETEEPPAKKFKLSMPSRVISSSNRYGNLGWSGIAFHPTDDVCATGRFFFKDVHVFKEDKILTSFYCSQNPTCITFAALTTTKEPVLAVGEYHQLSIYDTRISKSIANIASRRGCLYTIATVDEPTTQIGIAGADRSVYVHDIRTWKTVKTWPNCLKYDISYLAFSKKRKNHCYVAGFTHSQMRECNEKGKGYSVHADARWIGMDITETETLAGVSANGNLFFIFNQ